MSATHFATSADYRHEGYSPGHPWYYFLGGMPLMPRQILEATRESGYEGYAREDIATANALKPICGATSAAIANASENSTRAIGWLLIVTR